MQFGPWSDTLYGIQAYPNVDLIKSDQRQQCNVKGSAKYGSVCFERRSTNDTKPYRSTVKQTPKIGLFFVLKC